MAEERIDSLFDVPAILKERDTVLAAMKSITDEMAKSTVEASKQKSILTDAKTAKEAADAIDKVNKATKELTESEKKLKAEKAELERINNAIIKTQAQQSEEVRKAAAALNAEKDKLKELLPAKEKNVKVTKELTESEKKLKAEKAELERINNAIIKTQTQQSEEVRKAAAALNAEKDKLKELLPAKEKNVKVTKELTESEKKLKAEKAELERINNAIIKMQAQQSEEVKKAAAALDAEKNKLKELLPAKEKNVKVNIELTESEKRLKNEKSALERLNKTLVRAQVQQSEAGQKVVNTLDREKAELKALSFERQKAIQQERSQADYTRAFAKELDLASMNISEMQKELSRLNAMSFKGLDAKQIAHVKGQMAMLTEEIGDQRKAIAASGDKFNVMVGALQGLVGVTQLVTGTMSMFGIENKRLEKSMVQLIGISQGLTAIHELQEKGTLKVAAATIKETAAKVKLTIATWAQQKADTASVGVMQKVFAWIAKNPYIALAVGIAAATAAVYGLIMAFRKEVDIEGDLGKSQKDVFDEMAKNIGQFTILTNNVNKAQRGTSEYTDAINAYNVAAREQNLILIDVNGSMDDQNLKMKLNTDLLVSRAKIQAATNELTKIYGEQVIAQIAIDEATMQGADEAAAMWQDKLDMYQKQIDGLNKYIDAEKKENQTREDIVKLQYANEKKRQEILKMSTKATDDNTTAIKKQTKSVRDLYVEMDKLSSIKGGLLDEEKLDVFPEKIKYTASYIDQLSQSFAGLNQLLEEEQITPEEWAERWKALMEKTAKDTEDKAAKMKESLLSITDEAMKGFSAFVDWQNTKGDAQIQIYERQQADQQDILEQRLAAGYITQAQYDAQTAALEEAYNAKKIEIERQQAQRTKALAVFDVGINTAKAIMEIWGAYAANIPLALAFSALAATTGAFQLAAINAQPLPGYAHGRDGGDAEFAYTGEQGTEAIVTNGNVFFTPPTSTLTYLPAGASVIPAPQTASMIESGFFTNSTESLSLQKLDDIEKAIKNKREFHVNITDKGVGMSAKQAANFMNYINRNARI